MQKPVGTVFSFDNSFSRSLQSFYVHSKADAAPAPKLLQFNDSLAKELGL